MAEQLNTLKNKYNNIDWWREYGNDWFREYAREETLRIITQPIEFSGWDGVGYSCMVWEAVPPRCESFFGLRGSPIQPMLDAIEKHKNHPPMMRYYVAYGGADKLDKEVYRLRKGLVTVVAQSMIRGYRDGTPAPTVEEIQASELTMLMVREMCQKIVDAGQRYCYLHLLP